jgi:uncharacterized protein YxjI
MGASLGPRGAATLATPVGETVALPGASKLIRCGWYDVPRHHLVSISLGRRTERPSEAREGDTTMGLLRRGPDGPTFKMREKLLAIGDDFWIEDGDGRKVYKVNGKALRMRQTFILEDPDGTELAKIQEKKLSVRDKMTIERGDFKAVVHKRLIGIRDHYVINVDGAKDYKAHGNIVDHEYEIEHDGDKVAQISKKWFRVRETYGVQLEQGQDVPLILAITVCVDAMARGLG